VVVVNVLVVPHVVLAQVVVVVVVVHAIVRAVGQRFVGNFGANDKNDDPCSV
jgi:hypothetical protein